MFNLKEQLLNAGLVTKEQASEPNKSKTKINVKSSYATKLKSLGRGEQYALIRKWVAKNRLDKTYNTKLEDQERYYFNSGEDKASWLNLNPEVIVELKNKKASVMAFMSNQGLAHCVISEDIAKDVAEVFPEWVKS